MLRRPSTSTWRTITGRRSRVGPLRRASLNALNARHSLLVTDLLLGPKVMSELSMVAVLAKRKKLRKLLEERLEAEAM